MHCNDANFNVKKMRGKLSWTEDNLLVFRMIADLIDEIRGFQFTVADAMYSSENWKLFSQIFSFEHTVDLVSSRWSLELLTAEEFVLKSFDCLWEREWTVRNSLDGKKKNRRRIFLSTKMYFSSFDELFANTTIPATVARGNEISNAAAFKESRKFCTTEKCVDEFDHFHETKSNHCGLSVVSERETVYETSSTCHDVLQFFNWTFSK